MNGVGTAVVLGASGGLGRAVFEQLRADDAYERVFAISRGQPPDGEDFAENWLRADSTDSAQLAAAAEDIAGRSLQVDLLINCAGMLHASDSRPEKSLRELADDAFSDLMRVNALAPLQALQAFMPLLRASPAAVAVTLSAMVGSITDNRLGGWYSYRMSKAALNMGLRSAAIEADRYANAPVIVALHPGTTLTPLSEAYVRKRNHRTPQCSAAHILRVIEGLGAEDSGKFFNWDGKELPW